MNNIIRTIKNVVKHNIAKNLNVDIMNLELSNTLINCKKKIQSVKLNLQNGQVEIILRALEL